MGWGQEGKVNWPYWVNTSKEFKGLTRSWQGTGISLTLLQTVAGSSRVRQGWHRALPDP